MSRYNSKCPECGSKAYVGMTVVECSSRECRHYVEPKPGDLEEEEKKPTSPPTEYADYGSCSVCGAPSCDGRCGCHGSGNTSPSYGYDCGLSGQNSSPSISGNDYSDFG